jgi:hypothetical protein
MPLIFISRPEEENINTESRVQMIVPSGCNLGSVLEDFENFLRACGYVFDGHLQIEDQIEEQIDTVEWDRGSMVGRIQQIIEQKSPKVETAEATTDPLLGLDHQIGSHRIRFETPDSIFEVFEDKPKVRVKAAEVRMWAAQDGIDISVFAHLLKPVPGEEPLYDGPVFGDELDAEKVDISVNGTRALEGDEEPGSSDREADLGGPIFGAGDES